MPPMFPPSATPVHGKTWDIMGNHGCQCIFVITLWILPIRVWSMLRHTASGALACLGRKRRALVRCWETKSRQGVLPVFSWCGDIGCARWAAGGAGPGSSARRGQSGGGSAGFDGRRRHAQVMRDQQLAVVVDRDPRRCGPVLAETPVSTGRSRKRAAPTGRPSPPMPRRSAEARAQIPPITGPEAAGARLGAAAGRLAGSP